MSGLIRADGACLRLKLPVLTLGAGEQADVRLDGLGDLHCLLTPTAAGPALRSFDPAATLVNGEPTAAALLKDGDIIELGRHRFTVAWAKAAEPAGPLNDIIAERTSHIEKLLSQLQEEREDVEAETFSVAKRKAEIERQHQEARLIHERARAAAAKYLITKRADVQHEIQSLKHQQAAFQARQQQLEDTRQQLALQQERLQGEAELSNQRLAAAWAALTAAQQQLNAEKAQTEREVAAQLNLLDARKAQVESRESHVEANVKAALERLAALQTEIQGLEQRADQARATLATADLPKVQKAPVEPQRVERADWNTPIPLTPRHDTRSADQLLVQLRQQEQELAKERQRLAVQMQHVAAERETLHDQRAIVAGQIRQIEANRRQWQETETQTVAELEQLGTTMALKESELEAREASLAAAEQDCKAREAKLGEYRQSLDDWRASLTSQEARFIAQRGSLEAELAKLRARVTTAPVMTMPVRKPAAIENEADLVTLLRAA